MKTTRDGFGRFAVCASLVFFCGCITNPVTGRSEFTTMNQSDEIAIDREYAPQQIAADYGIASDAALNAYVESVGRKLVMQCQRKDMPYSFKVVNAVYANAYAFPGGTICVTRGLLAELDDEAQLAALLGHELGHVNARHTANQMTRATLAGIALAGTAVALDANESRYTDVIVGGAQIVGQGMLASYSRDQERQADQLGMDYSVKAGYSPAGTVGLMAVLVRLSGSNPSLVERMFSSHPMSDARYNDARQRAATVYGGVSGATNRDAFQSRTAGIRRIKGAFPHFLAAEKALAAQDKTTAAARARQGLAIAPGDPVGLKLLAASGATPTAAERAPAAVSSGFRASSTASFPATRSPVSSAVTAAPPPSATSATTGSRSGFGAVPRGSQPARTPHRWDDR